MSRELTKTSGIETRIDGDTFAELSKKLEDDRKAAEATKRMLLELIFNLPAATAGVAGATSQDYGYDHVRRLQLRASVSSGERRGAWHTIWGSLSVGSDDCARGSSVEDR